MKVYVIYDPLHEEVVCVHQLPNVDCPECKPIRLERENAIVPYFLEEKERLVQDPDVKRYKTPAILGFYDDIAAKQRKEEDICSADEEDSQPDSLLYHNPKTGKMQKLFTELNKVYNVSYRNHEVGDKGEAVHYCVEAESEAEAKELAMQTNAFTKHIQMKYFREKCLSAYQPKGNYVIGKVEYFEGDPRL